MRNSFPRGKNSWVFRKGWGRLGLYSGHPKRKRNPGGQSLQESNLNLQLQTDLLNWWNLEQVSSESPQRTTMKMVRTFSAPGPLGPPVLVTTDSPSSLNPERWDWASTGTEETPESKRRWRSRGADGSMGEEVHSSQKQ